MYFFEQVREKFSNATRAVVCAFGIVCVWYEDDSLEKVVAKEIYTNIKNDSFVGVETKLIFKPTHI